jgi:hypothetical protein
VREGDKTPFVSARLLCMSKNMRKAKFLSRTPHQKSVKDAEFESLIENRSPPSFVDYLIDKII